MTTINRLLAGLALASLAVGCSSGVKEETIKIEKQDPMHQVKSTLQNYANGMPLASEVTSYDFMIEAVRKEDPAKADILKAGLDDIKATKGSIVQKAKDLLKKLGLDDKDSK